MRIAQVSQTERLSTAMIALSAAVLMPDIVPFCAAQQTEAPALPSSNDSDDALNALVEIRGHAPTLLCDVNVLASVRDARDQLVERLGANTRIILEELVDPEDGNAPPRLYVLVAVHSDDTTMQQAIDTFILDYWSTQPRDVRAAVRIGSEYV